MITDDRGPALRGERQAGSPGKRIRSAVTAVGHGWRWAAVAVAAPIVAFAAVPGTARPATTSVQTIHLVAHETQHKFLNHGGFGDEEIFAGVLDNATGTTRVGVFAGTLTSVSSNDSTNAAAVDLKLPGGQITVQGFFFGTQSRIVHAVTGGTGKYLGVGGEFSFTNPSPGVLDMTLTLLR
jgi:hypothetical protein